MSDNYGMGSDTDELPGFDTSHLQGQSYGFDLPSKPGNWQYDAPELSEPTGAGAIVTEGVVYGPSDDQEEDFWGNAFDAAEMEALLKVDLPPEGIYVGTITKTTDRKNPFNGEGEISCYGRAVNTEDRTAVLRYELQPKKTYNEKNGKVVWNHILFKQAVVAYTKVHGGLPTSSEALKEYLEAEALEYRLVRNQKGTGMKVMQIDAAKPEVPF